MREGVGAGVIPPLPQFTPGDTTNPESLSSFSHISSFSQNPSHFSLYQDPRSGLGEAVKQSLSQITCI